MKASDRLLFTVKVWKSDANVEMSCQSAIPWDKIRGIDGPDGSTDFTDPDRLCYLHLDEQGGGVHVRLPFTDAVRRWKRYLDCASTNHSNPGAGVPFSVN